MQPEKPLLSEDVKKEVEKRILHRSACFQRAFRGTEGEYVLNEIDILCGYKIGTFHPDPYKHAYSAGQRSIAVLIHDFIDQDIEKARKMLETPKEKEKKDA